VGTQALEVCKEQGFEIVGLSGHRNAGLIETQARTFKPGFVCLTDKAAYEKVKIALADLPIKVLFGQEGIDNMLGSCRCDIVLNAIVGVAGLRSTLTACGLGMDVALANKESLVAGGRLIMDEAGKSGSAILPVDSEHSAIFQCLAGNKDTHDVRKIILTASGGAFFGMTPHELQSVTKEQALAHPVWSMGQKITIDCATMMNKGFELIEAMWLFGKRPEEIDIVVHRESVIHSMVEFCDGAVLAQLGLPDMKTPIQYALTYPERKSNSLPRLDLAAYGKLTFRKPDEETFICLKAAKTAAQRGGLYPCVLNAANETAVKLFLEDKISFPEIGERAVRAAETDYPFHQEDYTLDDIMRADAYGREMSFPAKRG